MFTSSNSCLIVIAPYIPAPNMDAVIVIMNILYSLECSNAQDRFNTALLKSRFINSDGFQSEGCFQQHGKKLFRFDSILNVSIDNQAVNHVIWSKYVAAIPNAQVIQNELSPGRMVIQPTAKAHISVKDVTVIVTPACFMVRPISSSILFNSFKLKNE